MSAAFRSNKVATLDTRHSCGVTRVFELVPELGCAELPFPPSQSREEHKHVTSFENMISDFRNY